MTEVDALSAEVSDGQAVDREEVSRLREQDEGVHSEIEAGRTNAERQKADPRQQASPPSEQYPPKTIPTCELVTARNLRVISVHDAGLDGKQIPTFGRAFVVQGKCLTFYVYDPPQGFVSKHLVFVGWGSADGQDERAHNLGVFHMDDATDKRWVLVFNDPQIMAEIDNFFITVEPAAKVPTRPHSNRILYTFIGNLPRR